MLYLFCRFQSFENAFATYGRVLKEAENLSRAHVVVDVVVVLGEVVSALWLTAVSENCSVDSAAEVVSHHEVFPDQ